MPAKEPSAVEKMKGGIWRYFGAMMMEEKAGIQAVSFTRTLAVLLFGQCLYKWGMDADIAPTMMHTLWGLIGIKGLKDGLGALKK
jgi:hypothetical protein